MLVAHTIERNTFELTLDDLRWMDFHQGISPKEFIRGILKRRFDDYRTKFTTEMSLAEACLKIANACSYEFRKNQIDEEELKKLFAIDLSNPKQIVDSFRNVWRGYHDQEVIEAQSSVNRDRRRIEAILRKMGAKNETRIRRLGVQGKEITKKDLLENGERLTEIKEKIEQAFRIPIKAAQRKVIFRVLEHRDQLFKSIHLPNDYFGFEYQIKRCDPDTLTYPLRFLQYIPAREYDKLEYKWKNGATREELILSFYDPSSDDRLFFNVLKDESLRIRGLVRIDGQGQIDELEKVFAEKCFTATTLLAITQTERMLWDFAKYLNRKGYLIFKKSRGHRTKYHPYDWDQKNKKYKNVDPSTKRPRFDRRVNLQTARQLLQKTRLGSIISHGLYTYLIDEFYDDRNALTHGNFDGRNLKVDAISSLLCYHMCLLAIVESLDSTG